MADSKQDASLSGLSDSEAREFHAIFMTSFIVFLIIAIVAHLLVWQWRPWLPGVQGYESLVDGVKAAVHTVMPYVYMA